MKVTKKQLRRIIKESLQLEMFDTGSAGDDVGGTSLAQKKEQCELTGGKWVSDDPDGKYGHCSKSIEENYDSEADEWYEDRHAEDQNDMGYYIAVALEKAIKSNPGISGAGLLDVVRQDPEYNALFKGVSDEEVWEIADEQIEESTLFFDVEEDEWYYAPEMKGLAGETYEKTAEDYKKHPGWFN
jgi:hypothetical protein